MPRETQKAQIERLQKEIMELKQLNSSILQDNQRLNKEMIDLQEKEEGAFKRLPIYQQLLDENSRLKAHNEILQRQLGRSREKNDFLIDKLKNSSEPIHNARGAGRKAGDAKQQAQYRCFKSLADSGKDMDEIMDQMQISRSTYFRYKKKVNDELMV